MFFRYVRRQTRVTSRMRFQAVVRLSWFWRDLLRGVGTIKIKEKLSARFIYATADK